MEIKKQTNLRGELTVPGDKSISHRAVMFGSLAPVSYTHLGYFSTKKKLWILLSIIWSLSDSVKSLCPLS